MLSFIFNLSKRFASEGALPQDFAFRLSSAKPCPPAPLKPHLLREQHLVSHKATAILPFCHRNGKCVLMLDRLRQSVLFEFGT